MAVGDPGGDPGGGLVRNLVHRWCLRGKTAKGFVGRTVVVWPPRIAFPECQGHIFRASLPPAVTSLWPYEVDDDLPRCPQAFRPDRPLVIVPMVSACLGGPSPTRLDPTEGEMVGHYGRFGEIQSSLIMGDLEAARTAPQSVAQRPFPPPTTVWVDALGAAANEIATASDLDAATQAGGALVQRCGSCHEELRRQRVLDERRPCSADDDNLSELSNQVMAAMGDQGAVVYGWALKGCADCHTR